MVLLWTEEEVTSAEAKRARPLGGNVRKSEGQPGTLTASCKGLEHRNIFLGRFIWQSMDNIKSLDGFFFIFKQDSLVHML